MAQKIKNLAVKTGSYVDNTGNEKGKYEDVGALMQSDDGSLFIVLKKTFNPAGVNTASGKDSVLISAFDLREENAPQQGYQQGNSQQPQGHHNQHQQGYQPPVYHENIPR